MKNLTLLLFIFLSSKLCAQIDTNLIYHKAENIIKLIEGEKIDSLLINSTDSIRCIPCNEFGINKYIPKKVFFSERMKGIFTSELISRLKRSKKMVVLQSSPYPAYVVFYEIFEKGEIAPQHEGVSFGIWLRSDENLKFTAIETIP